ncbi:MAG TPA: DUF3488 and transglutaminase-like domain-containing protein [Azospira sp.]|nr:DUF3488 and transglutaminase-like domain-containing protein [Azospira sp.]
MPKAPPAPLPPGQFPWLMAAALGTAAPHALAQPAWLSLYIAGLFLWRAWIWHGQRRLPPRWLLMLLVAAGVAGIGAQYHTLFGRDAGVALLALFIALKLMELRARRDGVVVLMLGYFLLLTHYFYSQTIPTGLWMLGALLVVTAALLRLHGDHRAAPAATLRRAALLLGQALPFMLVFYLLFPRVAGPLWGLPRDAHAGLTGLSDSMAPGSLSNLIQNGSIAFRVQFEGPPPPRQKLYWRGPVLDAYDGTTWRPRFQPDRRPPQLQPQGTPVAYTTTLEATGQRWLLALDAPLSLPPDALLTNDLQALAREPLQSRSRQTWRSVLDYRHNLEERKDILARALQLPPQRNPRTLALARSWQARNGQVESGQTDALVQRALDLFLRENFVYTLQPPPLGPDAIDDFLFSTRRGFCEHYASAFVVLMRAAGVPARVVTGYQGGEINPVDGYLTVRQSDAHAWAEVWSEGQGWQRVDPTAAISPARVESGIAAALPADDPLPALVRLDVDWLRQLRNRWEATNNAWNQWVLGYNPQRQREVLRRLGLQEPDWRSMAVALGAATGLILLGLTLWSLGRRPPRDPVQQAWQRFCARAARLGPARQEWEGPRDYARRLGLAQPNLAPLAAEAVDCYIALRYGPPLAAADLKQQLQQLRARTRRLPARKTR